MMISKKQAAELALLTAALGGDAVDFISLLDEGQREEIDERLHAEYLREEVDVYGAPLIADKDTILDAMEYMEKFSSQEAREAWAEEQEHDDE